MVGNMRRMPHFIKAKNENELQRKMMELQIRTHKEYSWLTIYQTKGGVVGWYYDAPDNLKELMKLLQIKTTGMI